MPKTAWKVAFDERALGSTMKPLASVVETIFISKGLAWQ